MSDVPRRWHIYVIDLSPRIGTKPGKRRPCLVLQQPDLGHLLSTVVVPLTTRLTPTPLFPVRVRVPDGTCGLRTSDIMIDQILAWENTRFLEDLGVVPEALRLQVQDALSEFFDLAA